MMTIKPETTYLHFCIQRKNRYKYIVRFGDKIKENKIAWEKYPEGNKREEVFQFAENYRKFISDCKTERECVTSFVEKAEKAGFVNLEKVIAEHTALKAGD